MMFGQNGYTGIPMTPGIAPGVPGLAGVNGFYGGGGVGNYVELPSSNFQPTYQLPTSSVGIKPNALGKTAALNKSALVAGKIGLPGSGTQPQSGFGAFKESMGGWGGLAKFGVDTVVGLGELYAASKALDLSRDQFNFSKEFAQTNLANQTKTYNTRLEDRATARAVQEGKTDAERDAYIAKNRLGGG